MHFSTRQIQLAEFETPIHDALQGYSDMTNGEISFDQSSAAQMTLTETKPYYARSDATVYLRGAAVSNLVLLAFSPGDGSGNESDYRLHDLRMGKYRGRPQAIPRSKQAVHTAAHLTIAAQLLEGAERVAPVLYAGSLSLLGLEDVYYDAPHDPRIIRNLGTLGQPKDELLRSISDNVPGAPKATVTTYWKAAQAPLPRKHIGDPHAVYQDLSVSPLHELEVVQVAGFIAVSEEHFEVVAKLKPGYPLQLESDL